MMERRNKGHVLQLFGGPLLFLLVWNLGLYILGAWATFWILGLSGNFIVVVMLAERLSTQIPVHYARAYERCLTLAFPVLLLLSWELLVKAGILNPRWFPPPSKIMSAFWDMAISYDRFTKTSLLGRPWLLPQKFSEEGWGGVLSLANESHLLLTLFRVFAGFLFGAVPGIAIGVVMGMNRTVRLMLDATMSAIYVLPKIAIFPLMMLIFANPFGEGPKIAVVAVASFFLVAINTMAGVRDIEKVYFDSGRNYGANRRQMFRHVIVPGALPVIFAGLRLALGTAIIATVAIEFVRAKKGAGFLILYYWEVMMPEKMYASLVVVMLLGITLNFCLEWAGRRIMPWRRDNGKRDA